MGCQYGLFSFIGLFQLFLKGIYQHIAEFLRENLCPKLGGVLCRECITPTIILVFADLTLSELVRLVSPSGQHFENGLVHCALAAIKDDMYFVSLFFSSDTINVLMDTACVELEFDDGSMIAIDTIAVENEVADYMYQRSELDYLIYNDPVAYAELILNGDSEIYLKTVTEYKPLDS